MRNNFLADLGLLLIRLVLAAVFLFHGSQKLFGIFDGSGMEAFTGYIQGLDIPYPKVAAWLAALSELLGGLALLSGFFMRVLALPLAFTMLVASFQAHGQAFSLAKGGMEYALTLGVVALALAMIGPGKFSAPGLLKGGKG